MKLIKSSYEILTQNPGLQGIYEMIELAGRTCYKSESNEAVTPEDFTNRMIKSGHTAMLEHGTVYLRMMYDRSNYGRIDQYISNKYSQVNWETTEYLSDSFVYITTNYRVIIENSWEDNLLYLCEPTEHHEKRVSVVFHTDRITGESFLRHRGIDEEHPELHFAVTKEMEKDINSFARQSTRYCNYGKDKFGKEVTFVLPTCVLEHHNFKNSEDLNEAASSVLFIGDYRSANYHYLSALLESESKYLKLLELGWHPQNARYVLDFSIYSPLVMTGFISDWKHFFDLRAIGLTGQPHPDAKVLAEPLLVEFSNLNLI